MKLMLGPQRLGVSDGARKGKGLVTGSFVYSGHVRLHWWLHEVLIDACSIPYSCPGSRSKPPHD